jgi:hypothetical protein
VRSLIEAHFHCHFAVASPSPPSQLRDTYGVKEHMVAFDVVEIIDIPGYGSAAAVAVCEAKGVRSQHDSAKLLEAKEEVYLKGFTEGVCPWQSRL